MLLAGINKSFFQFCSQMAWYSLYGPAEYRGRYGVLIHDSHQDMRLFHALLRGDFPSRWHQLPQWPLV
jgi:hypothetical protein